MHVADEFWRKVHYNALFGGGKRGEKALNAEFAETLRKDLRKIREEKTIQELEPLGPLEGGPTYFSAKPFICITITHRSL
jgi:hypothetical protein